MPEGGAGVVVVRPMRADDVPGAARVGHESLREAGTRYGWPMPPWDEQVRARGEARQAHLLATDPDGCWVADADGSVVGVGLGIRRGPLWFLSLLTVGPGQQGQGVGARLLAGALRVAEGAAAGMIIATHDPKALRRYALAGFDLAPGYVASGRVDRALLPVVEGVTEGDWATDGERVDDLGRRLRGATYGPDLEFQRDSGSRLLVAGDGFAVLRSGGGLAVLGAARPETAQALLWAALAEAGPDEVEVDALTAGQQWAVEVVLAARLALRPGESVCTRGAVGPLTPYLPSGAFG